MEDLKVDDPRRIGSYDIVAVLGEGGMGRVYLGRRNATLYAVKVMARQLARNLEVSYRTRFRREFEASKRVEHRFTAKPIEFGSWEGALWYACEYVPGPTLEEAVREGRFTGNSLAQFAYGMREALAAIHAAGIIHRDVKPSNVILGPNGIRVIDFGIAALPEEDNLTRAGDVLGTPNYMSPEQTRAEKLTPASDVFAYGSLLVFAATGRPPFTGNSSLAIMQAIRQTTPNLRGVPAEMQDLVGRCLRKEVSNRATLADVARLLPRVQVAQAAGTSWLPPTIAVQVKNAERVATKLMTRPQRARAQVRPVPPTLDGVNLHDPKPPARNAVRPAVRPKPSVKPRPRTGLKVTLGIVGALATLIVTGVFGLRNGYIQFDGLHLTTLTDLPAATFKPAKFTNKSEGHVAKVAITRSDLIATIYLTDKSGDESKRAALLKSACLKVKYSSDNSVSRTPEQDDSDVDGAANTVRFDGVLNFPGDAVFQLPCDSKFTTKAHPGQVTQTIGKNSVDIAGVMVDEKSVVPVLVAKVETDNRLTVVLPAYDNVRDGYYDEICLVANSGALLVSSHPSDGSKVRNKQGQPYRSLTFTSSAGKLYSSCPNGKPVGTGVSVP